MEDEKEEGEILDEDELDESLVVSFLVIVRERCKRFRLLDSIRVKLSCRYRLRFKESG